MIVGAVGLISMSSIPNLLASIVKATKGLQFQRLNFHKERKF